MAAAERSLDSLRRSWYEPDDGPVDNCELCREPIWTEDDLIETADGRIVGDCCAMLLLDGGCPACGEPILERDVAKHLDECDCFNDGEPEED